MSQKQPDYSWAEYLDYMEGGGSDVVSLPSAKPVAAPAEKKKDQAIWGVLLALVITLAAMFLSELPFWPFTLSGHRHPVEPVMLAIVLGMALSNVWTLPKSLHAGIKFSVKKLLPLGIVLLGARLNFRDLVKVGAEGLVLSVLETVVALGLFLLFIRLLKLPRKLGVLLGVGTAICGGTAIVATAPVIEAEEKDVVFSVATVTLLGLIAMFTLPVLGHLLELSSKAFGVWAGLAIHQTPQVVAANFLQRRSGPHGHHRKAGESLSAGAVVFTIGIVYARSRLKQTGVATKTRINYLHLFPMFVLGFLGLALLKTMGLIPDVTFHLPAGGVLRAGTDDLSLAGLAEQTSRFLIVISMAGVGLETKFAAMRQTGLKPFVASLLAVLVVALLILGLLRAMGI